MTDYANTQPVSSRVFTWSIALVMTWVIGFLIGCDISEPFFFLMMRSVLFQPVSIVGSLGCIFLPLLLTYVSFILNKPIIILIVCHMKAIAFGFSWMLFSQMFQSAAWLMRMLFLFSDISFTIVLFQLWFRFFSMNDRMSRRDIGISSVIGVCIAVSDYFVISPFLLGLF